jgi:hypothetical protein
VAGFFQPAPAAAQEWPDPLSTPSTSSATPPGSTPRTDPPPASPSGTLRARTAGSARRLATPAGLWTGRGSTSAGTPTPGWATIRTSTPGSASTAREERCASSRTRWCTSSPPRPLLEPGRPPGRVEFGGLPLSLGRRRRSPTHGLARPFRRPARDPTHAPDLAHTRILLAGAQAVRFPELTPDGEAVHFMLGEDLHRVEIETAQPSG